MSDDSTRAGVETNSPSPHVTPGPVARVAAALSVDAAAMAAVEEHLTANQLREVDVRQDDLMAVSSSDGRAPRHWLRSAEWRWFRYAVIGVLLVGVIWLIAAGVEGHTVGMGIVLILIMVFAAAPVWGAALLRGSEERAARARAIRELLPSIIDSAGKVIPGRHGFKTAPGIQVVCVKEDSNV